MEGCGSVASAVDEIARADGDGFDSFWLPQAVWSANLAGVDALTVFVAASSRAAGVDFGVAVLPIWFRHPFALAAQAQSVQEITRNRLTVGLGVGDRTVITERFGFSWRPRTAMEEYVTILNGLLHDGEAGLAGASFATSARMTPLPGVRPPGIVLAAFGERMLDLAGRETDGVVLLLASATAIRTYVAPRLAAAASGAGRSPSRIVCCLPVCVTDSSGAARVAVRAQYAGHASLPAYQGILKRGGASEPADVALIGNEEQIRERLTELAAAGASEFVAQRVVCDPATEDRTYEFLCSLVVDPITAVSRS